MSVNCDLMLLPSEIQRVETLVGIEMPIPAPMLASTPTVALWPPQAARAIARPTTTSPVRVLRTVPPLTDPRRRRGRYVIVGKQTDAVRNGGISPGRECGAAG